MTVFLGLAFAFQAIVDFFSFNYLIFRFLQGVLLVSLGVLLVLNVSMSYWRINKAVGPSMKVIERISSIWIQSYLIGIFFAVLAAPCGLVVFGTFFTLIGLESSLIGIVLLVAVFSLGVGTPFFLIAGVIPSIKSIILESKSSLFQHLPRIAGILIIFTGIFLIFDSYSLGVFN